ncbi:MAG: haloacid dehalogenase-like hydrolase [Acidaminococcaceae bacterium]|nr:haloacid dehalogenase-like hydrolase [Acidaminococcaceae bacterium]
MAHHKNGITKPGKLLPCLFSATLAVSVLLGGSSQAATRDEIAAIKVEKAADFQYWNAASPTLQKVTRFVEEATRPGHPHFIPVSRRVAVFDMDGTFYCETAPLYLQETMFLHRMLEDKSYTPDRKMASFAKKVQPKIMNKTGLTQKESKRLVEYLTKAYAGMTPEEYRAYVRSFMQTNEIGLTDLKRGEAFYLPMVEIISYLSNNGFAVYIDSACGFPTTRELVEGVIPIPADRIIATDFVYTTTGMGKDTPENHFYDRYTDKVVISGRPLVDNAKTRKIFSLLNQIGKKPVLAFGNSMGDSGMFEYTLQDNPYNSAAFCVLCDDTERELGDPEKAAGMAKTALKRGWNTISMRDEFKTIYGDNVKRADR